MGNWVPNKYYEYAGGVMNNQCIGKSENAETQIRGCPRSNNTCRHVFLIPCKEQLTLLQFTEGLRPSPCLLYLYVCITAPPGGQGTRRSTIPNELK